jgi:plasmid stabilization system protein ParE
MELKVFWTETALNQLRDIFDYYKVKDSHKVARNIVRKIVNRTIQLERNPRSGQKEPLLETRKFEYRYLVEGNYKIIYWIEDNYVKIATVFDSRQNPEILAKV